MTEQELQNQNIETFRDEGSDAWKLKGKTRAAEARGFFANLIGSLSTDYSQYPAFDGENPIADADLLPVQKADGTKFKFTWAQLKEGVSNLVTSIFKGKYMIVDADGAQYWGNDLQLLISNAQAGASVVMYSAGPQAKLLLTKTITINTNGFYLPFIVDYTNISSPGIGEEKYIVVNGGGILGGYKTLQESTSIFVDVELNQSFGPPDLQCGFTAKKLVVTKPVTLVNNGWCSYSGPGTVYILQGTTGTGPSSRPVILGGIGTAESAKRSFTGTIHLSGRFYGSSRFGVLSTDSTYGNADGHIILANDFYGENTYQGALADTYETGAVLSFAMNKGVERVTVNGSAVMKANFPAIAASRSAYKQIINVYGSLVYAQAITGHIEIVNHTPNTSQDAALNTLSALVANKNYSAAFRPGQYSIGDVATIIRNGYIESYEPKVPIQNAVAEPTENAQWRFLSKVPLDTTVDTKDAALETKLKGGVAPEGDTLNKLLTLIASLQAANVQPAQGFDASVETGYPVGATAGSSFKVNEPGTIEAGTPYQQILAVGDYFFTSINNPTPADWTVLNHNVDAATDTVLGLVQLATLEEAKAGQLNKAITSVTLKGVLVDYVTAAGLTTALSSLNADNIKAGTLPDSRLSTKVPRKDTVNEWTQENNFSSLKLGGQLLTALFSAIGHKHKYSELSELPALFQPAFTNLIGQQTLVFDGTKWINVTIGLEALGYSTLYREYAPTATLTYFAGAFATPNIHAKHTTTFTGTTSAGNVALALTNLTNGKSAIHDFINDSTVAQKVVLPNVAITSDNGSLGKLFFEREIRTLTIAPNVTIQMSITNNGKKYVINFTDSIAV